MGEDQIIIGHSVFEVGGCFIWMWAESKYFVVVLESNAYTAWVSYYLMSILDTKIA